MNNMNDTFLTINIGSSAITAVIARPKYDADNNIDILGVGISESKGVNKGLIINIEDASKTIKDAILKAKASVDSHHNDEIILGSDTVVALNNKIYGKPKDDNDAFCMLKNLSGKTHQVCTGIALIKNGKIFSDVCTTDVTMKNLSDEEILNYIKTKEPQDKAGAYAIQGLASIFIEKINGCYFNVVGLPLNCLYNLCKKADVDL